MMGAFTLMNHFSSNGYPFEDISSLNKFRLVLPN